MYVLHNCMYVQVHVQGAVGRISAGAAARTRVFSRPRRTPHVHTRVCVHMHMYVHIHMYVHMHVYMHVYMQSTCTHAHMHICTKAKHMHMHISELHAHAHLPPALVHRGLDALHERLDGSGREGVGAPNELLLSRVWICTCACTCPCTHVHAHARAHSI